MDCHDLTSSNLAMTAKCEFFENLAEFCKKFTEFVILSLSQKGEESINKTMPNFVDTSLLLV